MEPYRQIRLYLDQHGATYTRDALRKGLLEAGHDPATIDQAIGEWEAARAASDPRAQDRRAFGRWALGLHAAAVAAMVGLVVVLKGTESFDVVLLGAGVLAVALLIGWAISSLIGRALLPRTGLLFALAFPAISALLLGGTCFALMNASISAPPRDGTVRLQIEPPLAFEGSGVAACYVRGATDGVQVLSGDLATPDGRPVTLSITWYPVGSGPAEGADLSIVVDGESERGRYYAPIPSTRLTVDASADGRSGTIEFVGLAREPQSPDDTDLQISGSASWTCE